MMNFLSNLDLGTVAKWENIRLLGLCIALMHAHLIFYLRVAEGCGSDIGFVKNLPLPINFIYPRNREDVLFLLVVYGFDALLLPCFMIAFLKS